VHFTLFKTSTNFEYWKLDTSHSLPILKNAYCPLIFILQYCSLYPKFFFLDCFREAKPSLGHGKNWQNVNHFKFTTLLEDKFGATRNYWIIKNKSSQIQWMPTEYNKSHIQGILKKNGKNTTLHNFVLFLWRRHFKNSCIVFYHDFQTLENNKSTGPKRPRAFICFLVFGNRDETLTLVFEIVLQRCRSFSERIGPQIILLERTRNKQSSCHQR